MMYRKLLCLKNHSGAKPQAEFGYDTKQNNFLYYTDTEPKKQIMNRMFLYIKTTENS